MGSSSSSLSELSTNTYLQTLAGTTSITLNDPYWNQLLSFSCQIPTSSSDNRLLEEAVAELCNSFISNNITTGNLASLVQVFMSRAEELPMSVQCENHVFVWQTYNALFIIRTLILYMVKNLSHNQVVAQFSVTAPPTDSSQGDTEESNTAKVVEYVDEKFISCLMRILINGPVTNFTYTIHVEVINTLLVLLSVKLFNDEPANHMRFYSHMMTGSCSVCASDLMRVLIENIVARLPRPLVSFPSSDSQTPVGDFFYNVGVALAAGLWSMFSFPITMATSGQRAKTDESKDSTHLLANQSTLLLLVLTNHCTTGGEGANPYRDVLCGFADSDSVLTNSTQATPSTDGDTSSQTTNQVSASSSTNQTSIAMDGGQSVSVTRGSHETGVEGIFHTDLVKLYECFCVNLNTDEMTLLLYLLVHQNTQVTNFILSRTDIDHMVIPILRILYDAECKNSHHVYMALIILLILTEDEDFNKHVHDLQIKDLSWYHDRMIPEMTLGGVLILVVIRTIYFNISRMRDKYLHTNCLAALANMSSSFKSLHPYVTQKLISLLSLLSKKHQRLLSSHVISPEQSENSVHSIDMDEGDVIVLEEVIRMLLEIINSCLMNALHHNPNLIYSLLHKKDLFNQLRTHTNFQDLVQNIDCVMSYFVSRLCDLQSSSVEEVLEVIKQGSLQFHHDRMKKFPELKFKYVEEDEPEEFFIPYIWSLVYNSSTLYWDSDKLTLFPK